ncbi:MAG TPA: diguanylate cyclase [Kineosporiaceae bacterium]
MEPSHAYLGLCATSSAVALSAAIDAVRYRRTARAAVPLAVAMVGLAWWSMLLLVEAGLGDGPVRQTVALLTLSALPVVAAAFYYESRVLADADWRPDRRTIMLLALPSAATLVAILTNPLHHLLATFRSAGTSAWLPWLPGTLFWPYLGVCYLLLARCFAHLARGLRSASTALQRRQLRSVLITAALPTAGSLATFIRPGSAVTPEVIVTFIVLAGLAHYFAVFRRGLLRLLPVARGLVLEHVGDAIFVMDLNGRVVDLNPAARLLALRLYPDLPDDLLGLPARQLLPYREHRRSLTDGVCQVERHDGTLDLDLRITELADRHGYPLGRVIVARDVTELNEQRRRLEEQLTVIKALRNELQEIAVRDDLTGLHNRRYLLGRLELDLDRARSAACPLSVILLDIDHFKSVNDRFGHAVGDALLVATARALRGCVRAGDTVARYGGEEFVILLPGASMDEALHMAEVLRTRCATVRVDGRSGPVSTTVSAGVATFPDCGWSGAELLQNADEALYSAKGGGRDQVVCAPTM